MVLYSELTQDLNETLKVFEKYVVSRVYDKLFLCLNESEAIKD